MTDRDDRSLICSWVSIATSGLSTHSFDGEHRRHVQMYEWSERFGIVLFISFPGIMTAHGISFCFFRPHSAFLGCQKVGAQAACSSPFALPLYHCLNFLGCSFLIGFFIRDFYPQIKPVSLLHMEACA